MEIRARNILVGSLLGDGWLKPLSPRTGTSTYCVKYNDKSLGYLRWLKKELRELEPSELKAVPKYHQHYFYTTSRSDIGELRKVFYPQERSKRVPKNIHELLTDPLSLAIWYQDDGTLDHRTNYHWNAMFATYCFPYNDCELLAKAVKQNFDIDMSICRCQMRGKMYYRLYVPSKSMTGFIKIITPHMHSDYAYKISLI